MLSNKKKLFRITVLVSVLISGWLLTAYMYVKMGAFTEKNQLTDKKINVLGVKMEKTGVITKQVEDTVRLLFHKRDSIRDTVKILIPDTIQLHNRFENFKQVARLKENHLSDSIAILKNRLMIAMARFADQPAKYIERDIFGKSKIDSNAIVYVIPFRKSHRDNFFSPQKNFLRVYNKMPGGLVNNQPYFDYEETNNELSQLLFQFRAATNLNNSSFSLGPGLELKIDRLSINGAELYNTTSKRFTTSFGTRFDFYKILFK